MPRGAAQPELTVSGVSRLMRVSERSIYQARELQRCRPDLAGRVLAGEMSTREALRIAKPERYGKRDKVEQWLAAFRAWSPVERDRAKLGLAQLLGRRRAGHD